MKTKQELINESIERLEKLKQETILKYAADIDFEHDLSLYDVMMTHFVAGDLDDVFITDVTAGMDKKEIAELFELAREFQGLCFCKGEAEYWLDSLENTPIHDYNIIAYSIFDSFNYLLELAKDGGRDVLELLVSLRASEELRDVAMLEYLRTTFVDDRVLTSILFDMADSNSFYNIFTDEQRGILLNYPEGTLYSYGDNQIRITSPLVLGVQIYNNVNQEQMISEIDEADLEPLILTLSEFYRDDYFEFEDEVYGLADKYRDYMRRKDISLTNENLDIIFDSECDEIQDAWILGDEVLGGTYDTPYSGGTK